MADLRCTELAGSYGERVVLTDVDLLVPSGSLTAILGASGSGKTTLLRLLIGFIAPAHGSISIGDRVVSAAGGAFVAPDKREIGYVAQEGALFPHLTVGENVGFGLPRAERKRGARIEEALDLVGLDNSYLDRRPQELSGGEQRRVALGRALAPRPRVVLLDEPFSGLDAALRAETREGVVEALARTETTSILVTHDQGEALSTGHEVAVLRAGRLVQVAAPSALYEEPADLEVARFVGDAVVIPGEARGEVVTCALGTLDVKGGTLDGPSLVMIRPEQIRFAPGEPPTATVVGHTYFGAETLVRLNLHDSAETPVLARTFDVPPAVGTQVGLTVVGPVSVYRDSQ